MTKTSDSQLRDLQEAVDGRYAVERRLGKGGMGVVYLAWDLVLDRPVALKVLPSDKSDDLELRERLVREARTAARLTHPNIVPIHSIEEHEGFVFFAMSYVHGDTLRKLVKEKGALPIPEALRILREVAGAVGYAHQNGVVHRDIKADNVLLDSASGRAVVTDFGIARAPGAQTITAVGEIMGTAQYMSPEQMAGDRVDYRTDLYSLGVLAFFALTGTLPFDAPTVPELLVKHLMEDPPKVNEVRSEVSAQIAAAVDRCMAKDRDDRFESAEDFVKALDGQLDVGEARSPTKPSSWADGLGNVRRDSKGDQPADTQTPSSEENSGQHSVVRVLETLTPDKLSRLQNAQDVIENLEKTIDELKSREDVLDSTLMEAGGGVPDSDRQLLDELRSAPDKKREAAMLERRLVAVAQIESERDKVRSRISSANVALESIKVDLLRLRSDVGNLEEVTTGLKEASEICSEADSLLTGSTDIRRQTASIEEEIYRY